VTKIDLAAAVDFDRAEARAAIDSVRPGMTALETSAKSGVGMEQWLDDLESRRLRERAGEERHVATV
jgi:hydrogenase nickel incorporation protein HypB